MTLYSLLLLFHLLAVVVWVGGMAFTLFCLRPAAIALLPPPLRIPLMHAALGHFFKIVVMAIALLLATGVAMILMVGAKNMPVAWMWMVGLGAVMMSIFFYLRAAAFSRLGKCVEAQDWPVAARQLEQIRLGVMLNLAIGLAIIAVMKLGRY
ncbi:MAG: CopD family protein [Burkholderiales bacterium]|nr:CopD family protein [Burkholderiales bacterium]